MKRGKDKFWRTVKYTGDIAIYAKCKCGFEYACSSSKRDENGLLSLRQYVNSAKMYPYCPICGARKKKYIAEPVKVDGLPPYCR